MFGMMLSIWSSSGSSYVAFDKGYRALYVFSSIVSVVQVLVVTLWSAQMSDSLGTIPHCRRLCESSYQILVDK